MGKKVFFLEELKEREVCGFAFFFLDFLKSFLAFSYLEYSWDFGCDQCANVFDNRLSQFRESVIIRKIMKGGKDF